MPQIRRRKFAGDVRWRSQPLAAALAVLLLIAGMIPGGLIFSLNNLDAKGKPF